MLLGGLDKPQENFTTIVDAKFVPGQGSNPERTNHAHRSSHTTDTVPLQMSSQVPSPIFVF